MDKGAYLYMDKNSEKYLYIFMKMSQEELKEALPISYDDVVMKDCTHLVVTFHEGSDYLGAASADDITLVIIQYNMINILENNYEKVKERFPSFTEEYYNDRVSFSKNQLKIDETWSELFVRYVWG
jgi:hypothetical protein